MAGNGFAQQIFESQPTLRKLMHCSSRHQFELPEKQSNFTRIATSLAIRVVSTVFFAEEHEFEVCDNTGFESSFGSAKPARIA